MICLYKKEIIMLGAARETLQMPSWMQGERYIYCDRFEKDFVHAKKDSVWTKIMNLFS